MLNVALCVGVPPGNKGPRTDRRTADIQFPVPGYGRREAVEILLNAGANVHARDDGGLIPLHNACSFGHAEVVSLLLRAGADPNARDNWSYTPLHEGSVLSSENMLFEILNLTFCNMQHPSRGKTTFA